MITMHETSVWTPPSSPPHSPRLSISTDATAAGDDYGDLVDSDKEDDIEYISEPVNAYVSGAYYPISFGETLDGRYHVVHKLGWGSFSTVWMARDLNNNELVASKTGIPGETKSSVLFGTRPIS